MKREHLICDELAHLLYVSVCRRYPRFETPQGKEVSLMEKRGASKGEKKEKGRISQNF